MKINIFFKNLFRKIRIAIVGYDEFNYTADDARSFSIFRSTYSRETILKHTIKDINYLIHIKSSEGSKCLAIEMDSIKVELKEELIKHFTDNGFYVKIIESDDSIQIEFMLLVWSNILK